MNNPRQTLLDESTNIITRAKSAGRAMTNEERSKINANIEAVKRIDSKSADDTALLRQIGAVLATHEPERFGAAKAGLRFNAKATTSSLASKMIPSGKSLAPSGAVLAPGGLVTPDPVPIARPINSFLSLIQAVRVEQPPLVSYLRQVTRTNNAAPVADGDEKPVTVLGLERVEDHLRVVAHLSEGINRYWLDDSQQLRVFIEQELLSGLNSAVEEQIVSGDGTGENIRGLLATTGIQTQAWSTDVPESLRKALTKLRIADAENFAVALHPLDWEKLNLTRSTSGEFIATDSNAQNVNGGAAAPPYGAALLSSWGAPLVVSNAVPSGTGIVFDPTALTLYVDEGVRTEWDSSSGFKTNEVIARTEGRFTLAVTAPIRVVSVDLTA